MSRWSVGAAAVAAGLVLGVTPAQAQVRASEKATVSQTIAGTVVTIEYNRPSMRGRESIFGSQVPWGEVWTPGANSVTTLATTQRIRVNGQAIAPGRYGLWLEVKQDSAWVLHLHPDTTRWHVPHATVSEMLMSIPVRARAADGFRETLTWEFERVRADGAQLRLWWGRVLVPFDVAVESNVRTTMDEADARRYEGAFQETSARDSTRRYETRIQYDRSSRLLMLTGLPGDLPTEHGVTWGLALLPRGEGIFALGYTMNGEVAMLSAAGQQSYVEFTEAGGRVTSYERRDGRDRVTARAVRSR